jgi:large subunit ribosomal protein L6
MSRVGNKPIALPDGVTVSRKGDVVEVKGPKGTLSEVVPTVIAMDVSDGTVSFQRADEKKETRALQGLARALVNNMVRGVVTPFVKELEIQGVGYRADVSGKSLNLNVGYSHPVEFPVPEGLKVSVDRNVIVKIEGIDRCQVGQFAADVRAVRPPEPYKGKGIRYLGEQIRRKVGKAASGSAG